MHRAVAPGAILDVPYASGAVVVAVGAPADPTDALVRRAVEHFGRLDVLPGNVGYVELLGFAAAPEANDVLVAALRYLETTDAIIIDAVPESGRLIAGVENIVYVLTSLPDGSLLETDLTITNLGTANWFAAAMVLFIYYRRTIWFMLPAALAMAGNRKSAVAINLLIPIVLLTIPIIDYVAADKLANGDVRKAPIAVAPAIYEQVLVSRGARILARIRLRTLSSISPPTAMRACLMVPPSTIIAEATLTSPESSTSIFAQRPSPTRATSAAPCSAAPRPGTSAWG